MEGILPNHQQHESSKQCKAAEEKVVSGIEIGIKDIGKNEEACLKKRSAWLLTLGRLNYVNYMIFFSLSLKKTYPSMGIFYVRMHMESDKVEFE